MWIHKTTRLHHIDDVLNELERKKFNIGNRIFMDSSDPTKKVIFHILAHKEEEKPPIDTSKGLYLGVYEAALVVRAAKTKWHTTPYDAGSKNKDIKYERLQEEVGKLGNMNEVIIGLCEWIRDRE